MNTEDTLDLTTDDALLSSLSEHKIEDLKLYPFSLLRQAIATDLCDSSGSLFNAVVTVWVCTLTPEQALEAHQDLVKAKMRAFEWAEARDYSLVNYQPLLESYARLQREFTAAVKNRVAPSANGDAAADEVPNSGGQPA